MGVHSVEKKQLSARGILAKVRSAFAEIPKPAKDSRGLKSKIPLADCLMSGLAIFGLKFSPLLQFEQSSNDDAAKHNLNTLYQVKQIPCDTYMRERLDKVDPPIIDMGAHFIIGVTPEGNPSLYCLHLKVGHLPKPAPQFFYLRSSACVNTGAMQKMKRT